MPAFNFSPRFADMVRCGQKTQTIRKTKRAKAGDNITLYTGQRTSACLKLGEGTIISVTPVRIERCDLWPARLIKAGKYMSYSSFHVLAKADGFKNPAEMADWFALKHGLPFDGWLYKWRLNSPLAASGQVTAVRAEVRNRIEAEDAATADE